MSTNYTEIINRISNDFKSLDTLELSETLTDHIILPSGLFKDDYEYNEMYYLSRICLNQITLENMFNFLRLRDMCAYFYNIFDFPQALKAMWLQNILIIISSLIEATLQSTFERADVICKYRRCSDERCIHFVNSSDKLTYKEMINKAEECGILTMQPDLVHKIRSLRNNIHIHLTKKNLTEDTRYDSSTINFAFEVFDQVIINVLDYLDQLNSNCLKEG